MPRPVWADRAPDPAAVAAYLESCAAAATAFRFEPVAVRADPAVLHQAALARARKQLSERHSEADRILAQEVRAVDDLVRAANLLVERLREWYALHAPEAVRLVPDPETLARLVAEHGDRAGVFAMLEQARLAQVSLGTELEAPDLAALQSFAASLRGVHEAWRSIEARVGHLMAEVAPNLAAAVGPVLGARLVAQAGSLERLAAYPAGTVQLLGAETALFRHLKEGTKPPKHGLLFQHTAVHAAPPWQRGPAARALAHAAALAARCDAYTQRDARAEITAKLQEDLARIARRPAPRRDAPAGRGPPRGPPGGPRGPPRAGGFQRGPPRGPPRSSGPGDDPVRGPPAHKRAPARDGPGGWRGPPRRDGPRDGPRDGGDGPRGPPRDGPRGGKPYDKPRRKPQGAFRRDRDGPAPPPGRGGA